MLFRLFRCSVLSFSVIKAYNRLLGYGVNAAAGPSTEHAVVGLVLSGGCSVCTTGNSLTISALMLVL